MELCPPKHTWKGHDTIVFKVREVYVHPNMALKHGTETHVHSSQRLKKVVNLPSGQAGAGMGTCLANMSTSGGTLNVSFHRVVQVVHIDNEDSVFELLSHSRENGKPFAFWLKQCVSNCPCSPFWCIATMPLAA